VVAEWTRQINYPERRGLDKVSKAGTGPSGVNAVLLACCNKRVAEDLQIDRRGFVRKRDAGRRRDLGAVKIQ
jgi:hypothetical protein